MIKLRIILESDIDVIREINIDQDLLLEKLHLEIINLFNLDKFQMASFYLTDDNLNVSVVVDSFEGKKLNSPNDICVKSDDTIWFTDPPYGIISDYEGYPGEQEYDGCYVFRFNPKLKYAVFNENVRATTNLTDLQEADYLVIALPSLKLFL